jgi:putative selenate reductase
VDVCPNCANFAIKIEDDNFKGKDQILHLDGLCNKCGNCETFCPYQGKPYKDKFTLFWNEEDFENSTNDGFFIQNENEIKLRETNKITIIKIDVLNNLSIEYRNLIESVINQNEFLF